MAAKIKIKNELFSVEDASGVSGTLIWVIDQFVFRVTNDSGDIVDYSIKIDDLPITIDERSSASLYLSGNEAILDHSPAVLGLETLD